MRIRVSGRFLVNYRRGTSNNSTNIDFAGSEVVGSQIFEAQVVVVGVDETLDQVVTTLQMNSDEISICGVFYDGLDQPLRGGRDFGVSGNIDDLIRFAQQAELDHVILAVPLKADDRLRTLASRLRQLPSEVLISVEQIGKIGPVTSLRHIGGLAMLEIIDQPIKRWGPSLSGSKT